MLNTETIKAAASIERIVGSYVDLKKDGTRFVALCPFHQEKTPSFYVTPDMGIYKCFGCDAAGDVFMFVQKIENKTFPDAVKIVAAMAGVPVEETSAPVRPIPARSGKAVEHKNAATKITPKPEANEAERKHVATYPYTDYEGNLRFEVLRYEPGKNGKDKDFSQRRRHADGSWVWGIGAGNYRKGKNGDWYPVKDAQQGDVELPEVERVLWRLPKLQDASEIIVCEGERDVLTLESLGYIATTASGGSKQPWLDSYSEAVRGKRVIIFPDNDAPGESHGRKVQKAIHNVAAEVIYVAMPKGFKDITEYVESGRGYRDIDLLINAVEQSAIEADRRRRGLLSVAEVIERFKGGINSFYDPSKREKGILTGYDKLDEMTLGLHKGELFVLAARPSVGKTALALNIASNIVRRNKEAVGIFSLEMSADLLIQRMACGMASVDAMKYRSGYCRPDELLAVKRAIEELNDCPLFIDDYTPLDHEELRRKLGLLAESHEIGLVITDYLQLLTVPKNSKAGNRTGEVSEQSRWQKLIAKEFNASLLALSQLSRACEVRPGDHRPILSDLRESGSIEQDADVVGFLFREEMYRPDKESAKGRAELILAKQRNGPVGRVHLEFKHQYTRFDNPSNNWMNDQESEVA